jgi:hypothetical protein
MVVDENDEIKEGKIINEEDDYYYRSYTYQCKDDEDDV